MHSFNKLVHEYFDGLMMPYGLRPTISDNRSVRYEYPKVYLQISYDEGRSFEISVQIGKLPLVANQGRVEFTLGEILRFYRSAEASRVEGMQASEDQRLASSIELLASFVSQCAGKLLEADEAEFAHLERFRREERAKYARAQSLKEARKDAEIAWKNKDYASLIQIYKPFKEYLTASELKRLELAEQRL